MHNCIIQKIMQYLKGNHDRLFQRLAEIDWRKKPFRGLQRELARTLNLTPQGLSWRLYEKRDLATVEALIALVDRRNVRIQAARKRLDLAIKGMSDAQKI